MTRDTGVAEIGWFQQIAEFCLDCAALGSSRIVADRRGSSRIVGGAMLVGLTIAIDPNTPALLDAQGIWTPAPANSPAGPAPVPASACLLAPRGYAHDAQRAEVVIREVTLSYGIPRYTVDIRVGETDIIAGFDSGSTGLRILPDALKAEDAKARSTPVPFVCELAPDGRAIAHLSRPRTLLSTSAPTRQSASGELSSR